MGRRGRGRKLRGVRVGDLVDVRVGKRKEVLIEKTAPSPKAVQAIEKRVDAAMAERDRMDVRPSPTTDELMTLLRGDD